MLVSEIGPAIGLATSHQSIFETGHCLLIRHIGFKSRMVWDRNFASGVHGLRPRNLRRRVLIFDRLNIAQLCLRDFLRFGLGTEYLDEPLLLLYHQVLVSQELLRLSYLIHIFIDFSP